MEENSVRDESHWRSTLLNFVNTSLLPELQSVKFLILFSYLLARQKRPNLWKTIEGICSEQLSLHPMYHRLWCTSDVLFKLRRDVSGFKNRLRQFAQWEWTIKKCNGKEMFWYILQSRSAEYCFAIPRSLNKFLERSIL